jgi:outer membrane protein assembly factor BamB
VRTYALLLFVVLGFCPQEAFGAQRTKKIEPFVTPVLPAEQRWLITLPFPASAPPAMDEARIYAPLEGEHFIAITREDGTTVWTVEVESVWPPLVHDGIVLLAASDELHAFDAATGLRKWRVALGRGAMAPMGLAQGRLIVLVAPDEVWAFRPADGERVWQHVLGGNAGPASMAVNESGIYVAIGERLVRLMPDTGMVRWDRTLPGRLAGPSISRDRVLVGSTTNEVYALDVADGMLEWKYRTGGDVIGTAASDDLVFAVSLDNLIRALRRSNGNQIWKRALTMRPAYLPHVFDGVVAAAGLESVATFNAKTGAPIGTFNAPGLLRGVPAIDPTPAPFAVSIVAVTRDGQAIGLQPVVMLFKEAALTPLSVLPGRPLQKEPAPLP